MIETMQMAIDRAIDEMAVSEKEANEMVAKNKMVLISGIGSRKPLYVATMNGNSAGKPTYTIR